MNKNRHCKVFNRSCDCIMVVSDAARSGSKSASGSTRKSHSKSPRCSKTPETSQFSLSNKPPAQWIHDQAAIYSVASVNHNFPSAPQKRLGDGFYEQRLINEQVGQLTGRRFIGDYISGIAGNTAVRSTDAEAGLKKIFDAAKVQREINAQVQITQAFSKEAPKAVATFATSQIDDLKTQAKLEADPAKKQAFLDEADKWSEGGRYRVLLHTLANAFSGGVSGAAGAVAIAGSALLMNQLQDIITNGLQAAGLGADGAKGIAQVIATLTAAGVGAAVGWAQGAATAATVDANNRQLHPTERQRASELAAKGVYSKEQIEEQMRLMGNLAFRVAPNNLETLTSVEAISSNLQQDPGMPKAVDGRVALEVPGQANMAIQQYIIANTKDGAGYIPGASPYSISNIALNSPTFTDYKPPAMTTAACGNMDLACRSGVGVQQSTPLTPQQQQAVGEYFGKMNTDYQRAAALAAVTGNAPVVLSFEIAAGVTGLLEQAFKPSTGKVVIDSALDVAADRFSQKTGIPRAIVFETVERVLKPRFDAVKQAIDSGLAVSK